MSDSLIDRLDQQLQTIEQQTSKLKEQLQLSTNLNKQKAIFSYFSYSINYSHQNSGHLIFGNFYIHNLGNEELKHLYICLQLPENGLFQLTGKIVSPKQKQKMQTGAWERFTEEGPATTYWLKPLNQSGLSAGEKMSFNNFQIKWQTEEAYQGTILAYVYAEGLSEGVQSVNTISISGK